MDVQAPAFDDFIDTANVADMSDDHPQQSQQPQPPSSQQSQQLQPQHQQSSGLQHIVPQFAGPRGPENRMNGPRGPPLVPLSLSALPPHMGGGMPSPFSGRPMGSPAGQEHFELPPGMSTPRATNSTLHNINFDFYDGTSPSPMMTSMSPMPDGVHAHASAMMPQPMQPGMVWPSGLPGPHAPTFAPGPFAPALASMPTLDAAFQHRTVKLEPESMDMEHTTTESSPSTEDRHTSPASTAPTSLEFGSPPSEKKRRLTSPMANGTAGSPSSASGTKKGTKRKPAAEKDEDGASAPAKPAPAKRNPPSASQITESGQPFPVIDTSAKHSSLFVPPDTSGLTKREARLVKNRAAAFLSRQRKREQFEELETKCRSMCRLIWRQWEVIAGPDQSFEAFETTVLAMVLREETPDVAEVLQQIVGVKGASIAPTEDGTPPVMADPSTRTSTPAPAASVASQQQRPTTSDGPQRGADGGFPGPGRERSDSNITAVSAPGIAPIQAANAATAVNAVAAAQAAQAAELTHLRNQLFAAQQREAALQMELANERARRNGPEAHDLLEQRRPFRPGAPASQDLGLSLTMPPHAHGPNSHAGGHHGRTPSLDTPLALPGAFYHDEDLSLTLGRGSGSWESSPTVDVGSFPGAKSSGSSSDASSFGPAYAFAHDVHNDVNGASRSSAAQQQHPLQAVAQAAGSMGPKRAAGGMALMAMIFTFAFFGMPNAPAGPGGISRAPGAEALSLGRILGPVTSSDLRFATRKPRSVRDGSPSSHLSAQDLSIADLLGDTHIKDPSEADAEDDYSQLMDSTEDFRDAETGADGDGALQRAFGSSMDLGWLSSAAGAQGKHAVDVERGFILIGDPDAKDDEDVTIDAATPSTTAGGKPKRGKKAAGAASRKAAAAKGGDASSIPASGDHDGASDKTHAPTKLTLFVPAPSDSHRTAGGDGAAIDAWLNSQGNDTDATSEAGNRSRPKSSSVSSSPGSTSTRSISISASRTETLENASRAALEVLRNHRVAAAQAAAVARAKAGEEALAADGDARKPSPSQRAGSAPRSEDGHAFASTGGRDFLQLEFSLSGARVRNGRELVELLTTAASRAAH